MKHSLPVAIPLAILLGGGGSFDATMLLFEAADSLESETAASLDPRTWSEGSEIDYQPGRPRQPDEPVEEELPDAVAHEVTAAVWAHLEERLLTGGGLLRLAELPGRELLPAWTISVVSSAPGRFEVAVEMTAVTLKPTDFPTIGEAGSSPSMVARIPEQAHRLLTARREPTSFQITFEVRLHAQDRYQVVGHRITGRPGPRR